VKNELLDHIFFNYILARLTWMCFKEALGSKRVPTSTRDFLRELVASGLRGVANYQYKVFAFISIFMGALECEK